MEKAQHEVVINEGQVSAPSQAAIDAEVLRVARHDFKTPLTSLRMLAQLFKLALDRGSFTTQPERTARNCQLLMDQVDRLAQLADVLFEVSRIQSGQLTLKLQKTDLKYALQNALAQYSGEVLKADMPDGALMVEVDTDKTVLSIIFVLMQLKKVSIAARKTEDHAEIVVTGEFVHLAQKNNAIAYVVSRIFEEQKGSVEITPQNVRISLPLVSS
jgi:K+-sensing histidine kinase KdpD